jgi:hypothetical protein
MPLTSGLLSPMARRIFDPPFLEGRLAAERRKSLHIRDAGA